jgi:hypothetical protein
MATSKKNAASSKTAHVMNLLSKSGNNDPEPAASASEAQGNPIPSVTSAPVDVPSTSVAPAGAPHPNKPPLIVSMSTDAAVSEQIRTALEQAQEAEEEKPDSPSAPEATEATQEPESVKKPEPAPEPKQEPEPAPAPEPKPEPTSPPPPNKDLPDDITCVNIMQVLVDESADKYMKMFELCSCPRCQADVKALALNNLPPKYVVMEPGHVVPRITVYEGRYRTAVTAQLLRACGMVKENPRHDRTI